MRKLIIFCLLMMVVTSQGEIQNVALKKGINLGNQTHTTMTREEFHELADKRYNELQSLNKINNFYDYEKELNKSEKI